MTSFITTCVPKRNWNEVGGRHFQEIMEGGMVSSLRPRRYERDKKVTDEAPLNRERKSKAQVLRDYRNRLKADPERYKQHRDYETLRVKVYRLGLSEEKTKQYNEKTRQRMKKYRQRMEEEQGNIVRKAKARTRASSQKQKEQWRLIKQKQRETQSAQKRRRINERRRYLYEQKKSKDKRNDLPSRDSVRPDSSYSSNCAKRKAVSRTLRVLPKSPNKFAEVITRIIDKSTPRKRHALEERCTVTPRFMEKTVCSAFQQKLKEIKSKRSEKDNRLRRLLHHSLMAKSKLMNSKIRKELGLSKKVMEKVSKYGDVDDLQRKKRADALSEEKMEKITDFYQRTDVSREMPTQRTMKKNLVAQKTLEGSLERTYQKFLEDNPDEKISFSQFAKLRPSNVKPMSNTKYLQCLCEYCINVHFKVKSISRFCTSKKLESVVNDKYEASRLTLCPKNGEFYNMRCVERLCDQCGVKNLEEKTAPMMRDFSNSDVNWQKWKQVKVTTPGKHEGKTYMSLVVMKGTVRELVDELKQELQPYSRHLFNAMWQSKQFEFLKINIPEKWVLLCLDFGENYTCKHQDEAQSAHWHHTQVTIHPVVGYYRCPECSEPMHESIVFISEDNKHDQHAVQYFVERSTEYLLSRGIEITHQVQYSDGSPTQYKSKINFVDVSHANEDIGISTEKHYFGSRHGKGPCDGEVGVVKKSVSMAVASRRAVVSDAKDLFEYASQNLSLPTENSIVHTHKRRKFIFVDSGEINRLRPSRTDNIKTIKATRSLHCFRGVLPYIVTTKTRSCFCDVCVNPTENPQEDCKFQAITGTWTLNHLQVKRRGTKTPGRKPPKRTRTGSRNRSPSPQTVSRSPSPPATSRSHSPSATSRSPSPPVAPRSPSPPPTSNIRAKRRGRPPGIGNGPKRTRTGARNPSQSRPATSRSPSPPVAPRSPSPLPPTSKRRGRPPGNGNRPKRTRTGARNRSQSRPATSRSPSLPVAPRSPPPSNIRAKRRGRPPGIGNKPRKLRTDALNRSQSPTGSFTSSPAQAASRSPSPPAASRLPSSPAAFGLPLPPQALRLSAASRSSSPPTASRSPSTPAASRSSSPATTSTSPSPPTASRSSLPPTASTSPSPSQAPRLPAASSLPSNPATSRSSSPGDSRLSSHPADSRSSHTATSRSSSPPATSRSSSSPATTRLSSPPATSRSSSPPATSRSSSPPATSRSSSPGDSRLSSHPADSRSSHTATSRSSSPPATSRSSSPPATSRSSSPGDSRLSSHPADSRSSHTATSRSSSPPATSRSSSPPATTRSSSPPATSRSSSPPATTRSSSPPATSRSSSPPATSRSSSSPAACRSLSHPAASTLSSPPTASTSSLPLIPSRSPSPQAASRSSVAASNSQSPESLLAIPQLDFSDVHLDLSFSEVDIGEIIKSMEDPILRIADDEPLETGHGEMMNLKRFPVGTNIHVKNGSEHLKAVIVQKPDEQDENEFGLWVQYYQVRQNKRRSCALATLEGKPFFICWDDIHCPIPEPSIVMRGSRLYYQFEL